MGILKRVHFWVGVAGIIIFLLTGLYMHYGYSHLQDMDDGPRMLFRSAHIYFLLASIINLFLGVYLASKSLRLEKMMQIVISLLILIAPVLILTGFFVEPHLDELTRPYSRLGIYALFGAALLIMIIELMSKVSNVINGLRGTR